VKQTPKKTAVCCGRPEANNSWLSGVQSHWAAQYNAWLLSKLTLKGIVFSFLFFAGVRLHRLGRSLCTLIA